MNWEYMTKSAAVIPFSPGTVVFRDGMLSTLYYETLKTGKMDTIFCGDSPNHDEFIRNFDLKKKVLQVLCEIENQGLESEVVHPVGYCWVELPRGEDGARAALCGFAFYKFTRQLRALGYLGLYYWFNALKIDVVHGVTLGINRAADEYAYKLGFKFSASVPKYHFYRGELVDAVVVSLEKNDFLPRFQPWFEKNRVANPGR